MVSEENPILQGLNVFLNKQDKKYDSIETYRKIFSGEKL